MRTISIYFMLTAIMFSQQSLGFAQPLQDKGDAPDPPYPTLNVNNGASHLMGTLFLGNRVDPESEGQPSMFAMGDDFSSAYDDEDGVIFTSWLVPGQNSTVNVYTSGGGALNAWIDFDKNGSWMDPGEHIFNMQQLGTGLNMLTFAVPSTAVVGIRTYARFRFSTLPGMGPSGPAPDGEVEDYRVYIGIPYLGNSFMDFDPGLCFTQNEISMTYVQGIHTIVAAYNDNPFPGGSGIGVSVSNDNGQTWTYYQLGFPMNTLSGLPMVDAFDPSVTCDDTGNVYIAQISTDYNWTTGPTSGLFVHKSPDGGTTFQVPIAVTIDSSGTSSPDPNFRFNDRCQIIADRFDNSPHRSYVYVAWIQDRGWNMPQPYSDIYVSVSSDGGMSFSAPQQINSMTNAMGNMPVPTVASNGDVYVLWMDYNVISGGTGIMFLDKSTDGGVTWGNDIPVDTINLPPLYLNNSTDVRAKGAAVIRAHPTDSNRLFIVYAADPDPTDTDEADIFLIQSTDGGVNWSAPMRLNDDTTFNDQVLPWMDITDGGTIDVVWYDRRDDPADYMWDVYATHSDDGAASFAPNFKVNGQAFATPQTAVGAWFGEYLGVAVTDSFAFIGFTSSALDDQGDVLFASFVNPGFAGTNEPIVQEYFTIEVFPNPTYSEITVRSAQMRGAIIDMFDLTGRQIKSLVAADNSQRIDMLGLETGIYFITVMYEGMIAARKIIKQ